MKHIYITLLQSKTLVSRGLKLLSGDKYNHASISFDESLDVLYSFARKTRYNIFNAGFIEERLDRGIWKDFSRCGFCVLDIEVTDEEFAAVRDELEVFLARRDVYRYNILGLTAFLTGIPIVRPNNYYFCSQFVSHLLNRTNRWREPEHWTKPMDFMRFGRVKFEGTLEEYRRQKALSV
ncbi:hypothetical protein FACS1894217_12400 [Clostridia bacterium]|nr:hypothetical protein FACS1894217_12400 [Clostridia bacterium]